MKKVQLHKELATIDNSLQILKVFQVVLRNYAYLNGKEEMSEILFVIQHWCTNYTLQATVSALVLQEDTMARIT